jgi:oxygen-independent coproporphyrinogen III oxidase
MLRTPQGSALRFSNPQILAEYLRGPEAAEEVRRLNPAEELEEAWFLGLRLREGVAWQALTADFGRDPVEIFHPVVRELCNLDLLTEEAGVVRLTPRGVLFSNEVFARFLGVKEEFQIQ